MFHGNYQEQRNIFCDQKTCAVHCKQKHNILMIKEFVQHIIHVKKNIYNKHNIFVIKELTAVHYKEKHNRSCAVQYKESSIFVIQILAQYMHFNNVLKKSFLKN